MATEIRVPTLGESVTEATIGRWFKKPGDAVKADEPLVELETDKVTLEVNAPAAGVAGRNRRQGRRDGRARRAARPYRRRRRDAAAAAAACAAAEAAAQRRRRARRARRRLARRRQERRRSRRRRPRRRRAPASAARCSRATCSPSPALPILPPAAAPVAPAAARAPSPAEDAAREERVKMTKLRQTIARRLKEAQNTAAMLTTFNEVDMSALMACAPSTRTCSRRSMA